MLSTPVIARQRETLSDSAPCVLHCETASHLRSAPKKSPVFARRSSQGRLPRCPSHNFERPTLVPQLRRQLVRGLHNSPAYFRNSFFGHAERRPRNAHGRKQFSRVATYRRAHATKPFFLFFIVTRVTARSHGA